MTCVGWISLSVGVFSDGTQIDAAHLYADDPRIDRAREVVVVSRPHPSGSPSRDAGDFQLLELELDDGARWECIAASFTLALQGSEG